MPKTAQATSAAPASSGRDAVAPPPSRAASSSAGSTPGRASCGSDIVCTSFTCSAGTGSAEQRRELVVLLLHELGELLGVPVDDEVPGLLLEVLVFLGVDRVLHGLLKGVADLLRAVGGGVDPAPAAVLEVGADRVLERGGVREVREALLVQDPEHPDLLALRERLPGSGDGGCGFSGGCGADGRGAAVVGHRGELRSQLGVDA